MARKVILGLLAGLCAFAFFSCRVKPYEYGNIETPDALAEKSRREPVRRVSLSGKAEAVTASGELDADAMEKIRSRVEDFSGSPVDLDLSSCTVPSDENGDAALKRGFLSGLCNLRSVVLPGNLVTAGEGLFSECVSLSRVVFPEGLRAIEGNAFSGCVSLSDITAPGQGIYIFSYDGDGLSHPSAVSYADQIRVTAGGKPMSYGDWYMSCWNYSKSIEPLTPTVGECSVSDWEKGHGARYLADGTWGFWKGGSTARLTLFFTRLVSVSTLTFRNGSGDMEEYWKTGRAHEIDVYFGSEESPVRIELKDTPDPQTFRFLLGRRRFLRYTDVTLVLRSAYGGNDAAIAEISVNDVDMKGYVLDPFTRRLDAALEEQWPEMKHRIDFPRDGIPVALCVPDAADDSGEPGNAPVPVCLEWTGGEWGRAKYRVSALDSILARNREMGLSSVFSFSGGGWLQVQSLKSSGNPYGRPSCFEWDGGRLSLVNPEETVLIETDASHLLDTLYALESGGIYNVKVNGSLDVDFFASLWDAESPGSVLASERTVSLDLGGCSLSAEMGGVLPSGSIRGCYETLVLPAASSVAGGAVCACARETIFSSHTQRIDEGAVRPPDPLYGGRRGRISFEKIPDGCEMKGNLLVRGESVLFYCGGEGESVSIPEGIFTLCTGAFAGTKTSSIKFPRTFAFAKEACFDGAVTAKADFSAVEVESLPLETVKSLSVLLSGSPGISVAGKFRCVKADGVVTPSLSAMIHDEMKSLSGCCVYLDMSGTVPSEGGDAVVPEKFLENTDNLYWITFGKGTVIQPSVCRGCKSLEWVEFTEEPAVIKRPAFRDVPVSALARSPKGDRYLSEYASLGR